MLHIYEKGSNAVRQFTEQEVFWLQDLFLLPGLHGITTPSLLDGRELVYLMVDALKCYTHAACLTISQDPIKASFSNVYQGLKNQSNDSINLETITKFFLEQFYADFLWIELSHELRNQPWYDTFEQQLISFNMHKAIPIIVLS